MAANPLPTPTLTVTTERTPDETIVHCTGKITMENADQLRETARELIPRTKRVVLDFSGVTYLDSSGLGMIVGLYLSAKRHSCELRFAHLSPRVKEIFTLTRLGEVLEGHEEYLGLTPD